uniref:CPm n=1 Tax=Cucurbit yellow stunting disorder virus TaxID=51330 RepID=B8Y7G8_9CLOS|nr:CPm [Cucurbit yellow stunting disorder virus]QTH19338.1 minor coat protein [Cucurbit yellow stunting disorder virus]
MDREDFIDVGSDDLNTRRNGVLWCQSFNANVNKLKKFELKYIYTDRLNLSLFTLQLKFKLSRGNVLYEIKFNDPKSHNFKQVGLTWWSNAFEKLDSAKPNRIGYISTILIFPEGNDLIFSVNGFRFVKLFKSFDPTDLVISLTHPIQDIQIENAKDYCSNHVPWESVFMSCDLDNESIIPKSVNCYALDLNTNNVKSLEKLAAIDISQVKSSKDLNVREKSDEVKPKPKPKEDDSTEKKDEKSKDGSDQTENKQKKEADEKKNPSEEPKTDPTVEEKPREVNSKLKGVERYPINRQELKKVFEGAVEHYVKGGFSRSQAELIIFQMGVSFCTSKNSIGDIHSHLLWEKEDGKIVRVRKGEHVKMLYSFVRTPCNIERAMLRMYSSQIFKLLKDGVLVPGWSHVKRRNFKEEYAYMACDFYDFSSIKLSEQEKLAANSAQNYVLLKNKHKRSIVNVNQLW